MKENTVSLTVSYTSANKLVGISSRSSLVQKKCFYFLHLNVEYYYVYVYVLCFIYDKVLCSFSFSYTKF